MYRAYIRTFDGQVSEKTNTTDQNAAALAFTDLVNRTEHDGQKLAAALTFNNRQLAFHRFDRAPGDADYWRDKLGEIEWPQRGGARAGSGAKPADGASGMTRYNITLDDASDAIARALGDGDRSLGIRRALALAKP
jgi:hypothetical protein